MSEHEPEAVALAAAGSFGCRQKIRHRIPVVLCAYGIVTVSHVVEEAQVFVDEVFFLHQVHGVFSLVIPVECAVAESHPETGFGHHFRKPGEMLRDVEESGSCPEEVTVEILSFSQSDPGVVKERIELLAGAEGFFLGRTCFFLRFFLDGMQLDGLLHLFDGALEVAGGLRQFLVGACGGGVYHHCPGVVILIGTFHFLELFVVMGLAVVIDVVARGERLPVARGRSVAFHSACRQQQAEKHRCKKQRIKAPFPHIIKTRENRRYYSYFCQNLNLNNIGNNSCITYNIKIRKAVRAFLIFP